MSILSFLTRQPKTVDGFIEKAKSKGHTKVNISLACCDIEGFGVPNYHNFAFLEAGKIKLKLHERVHVRTNNLYHVVVGKAENERDTLRDAIETAETLQGAGLDVTIIGESVDSAREALAKYDVGIEEMRQEYAKYL